MLRERLPAFSDFLSVSGWVTLIAFSWTLLVAFNRLPSWILMFTVPELLGIFSYALMFSLLDYALVLGTLLLLAMCMPPRWISRDFIAKGGVLALIVMGVPVIYHFLGQNFYNVSNLALLQVAFLAAVLAVCLFLLLRIRLFRSGLSLLVERSRIFVYIYLPLGLLALLIVIIRNI